MNHYHLVKDDLESLNDLSTWLGHKDPMSNIPAKVKSAFTRAYNKSAPTFSLVKIKKNIVDNIDVLDDEETNVSDNEDDDDIANDALISVVSKSSTVRFNLFIEYYLIF
jgi:replication factor C subunit 1